MAICNLPADQDCGYPQCRLHGGKVRHHEHDLPKLKGNQNVRNTEKGAFAKETERFDAERVLETDKERVERAQDALQALRPLISPWLYEWFVLGDQIETASVFKHGSRIDTLAINAVIHAQVLKRP